MGFYGLLRAFKGFYEGDFAQGGFDEGTGLYMTCYCVIPYVIPNATFVVVFYPSRAC